MDYETTAFVLLSGGIDSSTALSLACRDFRKVRCFSINYGQRHSKEIEYAAKVANFYSKRHSIIDVSGIIPKTMLTDEKQEIPSVSYADLPKGISPTYVPFRNGLMLSVLASHIQGFIDEGEEAVIYFGAHAEDAANWAYPDCTFEFTGAMANAIHVGTYNKVRLIVPFQFMMKSEIVELGTKLKTPYYLTWSCYVGGEKHCGVCPTCRSRKDAFVLAKVEDPTEYVE